MLFVSRIVVLGRHRLFFYVFFFLPKLISIIDIITSKARQEVIFKDLKLVQDFFHNHSIGFPLFCKGGLGEQSLNLMIVIRE